jgi:hypothetical protein
VLKILIDILLNHQKFIGVNNMASATVDGCKIKIEIIKEHNGYSYEYNMGYGHASSGSGSKVFKTKKEAKETAIDEIVNELKELWLNE